MTLYEFVVSFIGEVPEAFTFIYTIITAILALIILGTLPSIFYFILRLFRGR